MKQDCGEHQAGFYGTATLNDTKGSFPVSILLAVDNYRPRSLEKQGDNALGRVRLCVCQCIHAWTPITSLRCLSVINGCMHITAWIQQGSVHYLWQGALQIQKSCALNIWRLSLKFWPPPIWVGALNFFALPPAANNDHSPKITDAWYRWSEWLWLHTPFKVAHGALCTFWWQNLANCWNCFSSLSKWA